MKKSLSILAAVAVAVFAGYRIYAHCEIPCGIYDDPMRIRMINEHIATIAKSIHEIQHLEKEGKMTQNYTRWINNKEDHANQLQHIITQYFMTQRVVPVADSKDPKYAKYIEQLTLLHHMLVETMKAKQSADPAIPEKLLKLSKQFEISYFGKEVNLHHH